jgi:hypothetical protein
VRVPAGICGSSPLTSWLSEAPTGSSGPKERLTCCAVGGETVRWLAYAGRPSTDRREA